MTGVAEVTVPGGRGNPNTCLVGVVFNLGDMRPFLGDLHRGREWVREVGRGYNESGRG